MKIGHLSDTHLGYAGRGIQRWVDNPWLASARVRQREADIMMGLERAITLLINKVRPDLVIHTGDLFDSARPTAQTLDFAMTQLRRLTDEGISVLIAEGVHSYPREYSRGHALRILSHLNGITVFYEDEGQIRIGDVLFHILPYRATVLGRVPHCPHTGPGSAPYNVLVAHAVADGHPYFRGYRPAMDIAIRECAPWYDYVALGHYHRFAQVPDTDRAFYSGATAMVTWGDLRPGYQFGLNVIDIEGGADGQPPTVVRETIESRAMHVYGLDDASGLTAGEVVEFLRRQACAVPPANAYCQVVVEGMDPLARREISVDDVEDIFREAAGLELSIRARSQRWDATHANLGESGDPYARLAALAAQMDGDAQFREAVLALGTDMLDQATERVAAEDLESGSAGRN